MTIISEILHVRNKIWQKISYKLINRFNYKINKPFLRPSHIGLVSVAQEANGKFSFSFIVSLSPELCHYNFCPLKACFPCFYWVWYIWCMNNRVHAHEFIIFFVDIDLAMSLKCLVISVERIILIVISLNFLKSSLLHFDVKLYSSLLSNIEKEKLTWWFSRQL